MNTLTEVQRPESKVQSLQAPGEIAHGQEPMYKVELCPIPFGRLAKGNYFRILNWRGEASGSVLEKTGARSARRCDVTLPPMRFRVGVSQPIVWCPLQEVAA